MTTEGKSSTLNILSFKTPHMRAFHLTWFTFFLCFFGWFGIAPLMPVVRKDLNLSQAEIGNIIIASVAITIFARLLFGWLCDRIGPRICYSVLLILGSIPVMAIGFSNSYETFLLFRLSIGVIGASFVITQYHTSAMFAKNVVGTANATAAGWGNMGGGATLIVMPLVFAAFVAAGFADSEAWRLSMVIPGAALFGMGFIYYFCTQDTPEGNFSDLRKTTIRYSNGSKGGKASFFAACRDWRVWMLFLAYGACFGIEITIDNIATLYFVDNFDLGIKEAGLIAGLFGMMNIFARSLGGIFGDKAGKRYGLKGRMIILGVFLFVEGLGIILFSQIVYLPLAIAAMLFFALFLKMSNGATYSVVPFINRKALGAVSGIVGAGGNVGAVVAGCLFSSSTITYRESLYFIGVAVAVISLLSLIVVSTSKVEEEVTESGLKEAFV